jgi:WD40 repeat protein
MRRNLDLRRVIEDLVRMATASQDGTAKVWDMARGQALLTLKDHGGLFSVAWSPDGKRLATASDDQTVLVYAVDIRELKEGR